MKRKKKPDLLSVPNENCPYVSNDHPPICQQPPASSCLKCPEYLDGLTDLIPWDKEKMTDDEKTLIHLYKKRSAWYAELDPIFKKIHALDGQINEYLARVRKAQGR